MQFMLDKSQKSKLFEQAREQLLAAVHIGKLHGGDRLPSVRQVALLNKINLKTAFSIYQRLNEEGYIYLRQGAGAFVVNNDNSDLEQAYYFSVFKLLKAHLSMAGQMKLKPKQYVKLAQIFINRSQLKELRVAVIECNEEQIGVFAKELSNCLGVRTYPVLLDQLESPTPQLAKLLARIDYFVTTDFHSKQVSELTTKYQKKLLQLRLNPKFVPEIIAAARSGRVLMIVSNTNYFPAFRQSLLGIGTPRTLVERITAIASNDIASVRACLAEAQTVYVSSISDQRVRKLIPAHIKELQFDSLLSQESTEALEAAILFHNWQNTRLR